jgi:hypothetical protein
MISLAGVRVAHYSVVLSGFKRGEEFFRGRKMKQGMKVAAIERVIQSVPCILKQGLSLDEAKRFEGLFRDAGAIVEVRKDGVPIEPPAGDGAAAEDRKSRYSQPRLTPLVQPLPAPPEEPPPPQAPLATGTDPGMLDLMEAAPPPQAAEATAVPAPTAPGPLGDTGLLPALPTTKPPAVFVPTNPWILRGLAGALVLVVSLIAVSCVSSYTVADRIHDFSATVEDQLANDLVGVARSHGGAVGEADLYALLDGYARRAHVKVELSGVRAGLAVITPGPGGGCTGVLPPMAEAIPPQKRMAWMLRMRSCAPEPWIIAFDVSITGRFGLSRNTVRSEEWIFASAWSDGER